MAPFGGIVKKTRKKSVLVIYRITIVSKSTHSPDTKLYPFKILWHECTVLPHWPKIVFYLATFVGWTIEYARHIPTLVKWNITGRNVHLLDYYLNTPKMILNMRLGSM